MKIQAYDYPNNLACVFFSGHVEPLKDEFYFEWISGTKDLEANRLFVMDVSRKWYHDCIGPLFVTLKTELNDKKALLVGASMGGYAALLFGHLLGLPSVSFSPQTDLMGEKFRCNELWQRQADALKGITDRPEFLDIGFVSGKQHHIYYGSRNETDTYQAKRVDCTHIEVDTELHNSASELKKQGRLHGILSERLAQIKEEP